MPNPEELRTERLQKTWGNLPQPLHDLILPDELQYVAETNSAHCDLTKLGGSKFLDKAHGGVDNILEVLEKDSGRIIDGMSFRGDDRGMLFQLGAPEQAFLRSNRMADDPPDIPEALYYKVDNINGKLGIIKLGGLKPETRVLIRREKSQKNSEGKETVPCSFTAIQGTFDELPNTNFATVIIGREGGKEGRNALWSIHPGAPIRSVQSDTFPGAQSLLGPEKGKKQRVIVTTVEQLLARGGITKNDYIKIVPGDFDEAIKEYEMVEKSK